MQPFSKDRTWTPKLITTCLVVCILLSACEHPDRQQYIGAKQVWRFAIEEAEGSVQHEYALKFKELIEQRTAGEIEVEIYPYGTLGTSTHITEQLNMGIIEFAMASPGSLGKFIPELQVFLLHFLFSEDDAVNKQVLSDPKLLTTFDALYAEKGLKLLSIYPEGEMVWTTNKEIRRPEDFQGVKMRVMTSPILLAAYDAYGASATPMPYSEVYSALQLNMIDGQVNPVFAIERQKFYEVTRWMIFPKHAQFITTCAANRKFFDHLSDKNRRIVLETIADLNDYIFDVQTRFQTERLKTILEEKQRKNERLNICGDLDAFYKTLTPAERAELVEHSKLIHVTPPLTEAERDEFRRLSLSVQNVFLDIGGPKAQQVLDQVRRAVARGESDRGLASDGK